MDRYYIDERVGCIAVRDSEKDDPESSGHLDANTRGVVRYWHGVVLRGICDKCKQSLESTWTVHEEDRNAAQRLCEELNKQ